MLFICSQLRMSDTSVKNINDESQRSPSTAMWAKWLHAFIDQHSGEVRGHERLSPWVNV